MASILQFKTPFCPLARRALVGPRHPGVICGAKAQKDPSKLIGASSTKGTEAGTGGGGDQPQDSRRGCLMSCPQTLLTSCAADPPSHCRELSPLFLS